MNTVLITGNVARDPIIRTTKNGKAVATFTVGSSYSYNTPRGEQKQITDWVNVVAWGSLAELVGNTCQKGTGVFVQGKYTTRSYDDPKTNQRKWVTEVTAEFIAPSPRRENSQPSQSGYNAGYQASPAGGQNDGSFSQFGEAHKEQPASQNAMFPAGSDEIPF